MSSCSNCGMPTSNWGLCATCKLNKDASTRHDELVALERRREISESIRHMELIELENKRIKTSIRLANEADLKNEDAYQKGLDYDLNYAVSLSANGTISLNSDLENDSGYILDRLKQSFVEGVKENFVAEFSDKQVPVNFLANEAEAHGYEVISSYYSQLHTTYVNSDNTPTIAIIDVPSKTGKYKASISGVITPNQIDDSEFVDEVTGELRFNANKFSVFDDRKLDEAFFKGITDYYKNNLNSPDKKQARLNQLKLEQIKKDERDQLARNVLLGIGIVILIFFGLLIFNNKKVPQSAQKPNAGVSGQHSNLTQPDVSLQSLDLTNSGNSSNNDILPSGIYVSIARNQPSYTVKALVSMFSGRRYFVGRGNYRYIAENQIKTTSSGEVLIGPFDEAEAKDLANSFYNTPYAKDIVLVSK